MKPGDALFEVLGGNAVMVGYVAADAVEYAICQRRGHAFEARIGNELMCRFCGLRVRDTRTEVNPPAAPPD